MRELLDERIGAFSVKEEKGISSRVELGGGIGGSSDRLLRYGDSQVVLNAEYQEAR